MYITQYIEFCGMYIVERSCICVLGISNWPLSVGIFKKLFWNCSDSVVFCKFVSFLFAKEYTLLLFQSQ